MSIFCIGTGTEIVPDNKILPEMETDVFFKPGKIHGGDYLINVYLNTDSDPVSFEVNYFTKALIDEAASADPSLGDDFWQYLLSGSENFGCYNDGSGSFAELIKEWPNAIKMSNSEIVSWAKEG